MLTVSKSQTDHVLTVVLKGSIDESAHLEQQIGPLAPAVKSLVAICREIPRLNSDGVKLWVKYFQSLQAEGIQLTFRECSPAVVQQINFISNFTCGGKVESIYLPYCCTQCNAELERMMITAQSGNQLPQPMTCPKCGGTAVFDDIPAEYFSFLNRP